MTRLRLALPGILPAAALLLAVVFVASEPAVAAPLSYGNPYKSFNISGRNYGSLQWEKQHRYKSSSRKSTTRYRWFGRRRR